MKAYGFVVSNRIGMKFGRIVLQVKYSLIDRVQLLVMTPSVLDRGHNVISRKVLPPGEFIRSVCRARPSVPDQ